MKENGQLYERFKEKVISVSGECYRAPKAELAPLIKKIFEEKEIDSVSIFESPLMREAGLAAALTEAGVSVHTDHIRKHAETDKAGITEFEYGIAELGSVVQLQQEVDGRIAATLVEIQIALVKGSGLLPELDTMIDLLSEMPQIPNFVGFVTGPSRTADIECVTTIGVHGPLQFIAVVVDDE